MCPSCERRFVVASPAGQMLLTVVCVIVLGIAVLISSGRADPMRMVATAFLVLIGVGGLAASGTRLVTRMRFPVLSQSGLAEHG